MRFLLCVALLSIAPPAFAQQNDPAFMQRAITALQGQRNEAQDRAAAQQARADGLAEELSKVQSRLKELEPKTSELKPEPAK